MTATPMMKMKPSCFVSCRLGVRSRLSELLGAILCCAILMGSAFANPDTDTDEVTFKRGVNISHWLAQNMDNRTYGADWFSEKDMTWIAEQGFDHVRMPVDARKWMSEDGSLKVAAVEPFDRACGWAKKHGLGIVLDMHTMPGANFSAKSKDNSLFTNEALLTRAENFWGEIASKFADAGPWLRFELLNEPVAEKNEQLNPVQDRLLAAIRKISPDRVVYLTCNKWSKIQTLPDLKLPKDPNIAVTVHFYDPLPFTHQRTGWTEYKRSMPQVDFPGEMPDLSKLLPRGHSRLELSNTRISQAVSIDPEFKKLADWASAHAPGLEIYIGEFGVYKTAPPESIRNYYKAVVTSAEQHGFNWAAWDYRGGFSIRDSDGDPTVAMRGIKDAQIATPTGEE